MCLSARRTGEGHGARKRVREGWVHQAGVTLIEVLVTMVVLAFGLLGLAGLQTRMSVSEGEAYQRSQALLLMADIQNSMAANRPAAASYVTTAANPVGAGMTCPDLPTPSTRAQRDLKAWCESLQGAAETLAAGAQKAGTLIGGRGCVESLGSNEYMITVAWQGLAPIAAPPTSVACGKDLYDGGNACAADRCRRTVTMVVRMGAL